MIRRRLLERHLRRHGCVSVREGRGTASGRVPPAARPCRVTVRFQGRQRMRSASSSGCRRS